MDYSREKNRKQKINSKSKSTKNKNRALSIFWKSVFLLIMLGGFAALGIVLGVYVGVVKSAPVLDAMVIVPSTFNTRIVDKDGVLMDELHSEENRVYAKLEKIPKYLQDAVVALEDERFFSHNGIDLRGIMRAVYVNISTMSLSEGASTITQQLIKNNVLKDSSKKFDRKIQEQYLALKYEDLLETKLSSKEAAKKYILELYLNSIALDNNYNGVQAAAKGYFNKDVSELSLAECASIASITQHPSSFSPKKNYKTNKKRQETTLQKMLEQNYITESEFKQAIAEDMRPAIAAAGLAVQEEQVSEKSYYTDATITQVIKDLVSSGVSMNEKDATNLVYSGGLTIKTPYDRSIQAKIDEAFQNTDLLPRGAELEVTYILSVVNKNDPTDQKHFDRSTMVTGEENIEAFKAEVKAELIKEPYKFLGDNIMLIPQPQAAFIILDHNNGHVLSMAGGVGDKSISRSFNRATQAKRQPGSTFKILAAYAPALDLNLAFPATVLIDEPLKVGSYEPRNYDHSFRGPLSMRANIAFSRNIPAVKAMLLGSIETSFNYLLNFGFTTLIGASPRTDGLTDKVVSLPLGGLTDGVTMMELSAAYGTIANSGQYIEPVLYTQILSHSNTVLLENVPEPKQVIKKTTAFLLVDMMKDVLKYGTGTTSRFSNMEIIGKTGTTSDNKDLLFAGSTPYYTAVMWRGYDKYDSPNYVSGVYHQNVWRTIMAAVHADLPYKDFAKPDGLTSARVCKITGMLPLENYCLETLSDFFPIGNVPNETCTGHGKYEKVFISICNISEKVATIFCPDDNIVQNPLDPLDLEIYTIDENGLFIFTLEQLCNYHVDNELFIPGEEPGSQDTSKNETTSETESTTSPKIKNPETTSTEPQTTSTPETSSEEDTTDLFWYD